MKLSACLIVKNEEKNIGKCLESVKSIVNQIVVVDTGSTDKTVDIAKSYGAEVHFFKWVDDFAKARNYAKSKAKGEWIIFLDADEYLVDESIKQVHYIINLAKEKKCDTVFTCLVNYNESKDIVQNSGVVIRIFRNDQNIAYTGSIHERLIHKSRELTALNAADIIRVIHTGYSEDVVESKSKSDRNLKLLLSELERNPNSSDLCFYIAEAYKLAKDHENTMKYAYKVIEYNNGNLFSIKQKNYVNLIDSIRMLNYPKEKYKEVLYQAIKECPEFSDFYNFLSHLYITEGRIYDTIEAYNNIIKYAEISTKYQSNVVFWIDRIHADLGTLYYKTEQIDSCISNYVKSLKYDKYSLQTISNLLMVLAKYEKNHDIYTFMQKIYDYNKSDDLLCLLNASFKSRNYQLAKIYYNMFNSDTKNNLNKEEAQLNLLIGNYTEAAQQYKDLCVSNSDTNSAFMSFVSAHLSGKKDLLDEISQIEPVKIYADIILNCKIKSDLNNEEKQCILNIISQYIFLGKLEAILNYEKLLCEMNLVLEVAEIAYSEEKYDLALDLYGKINECEYDISEEKEAQILVRIGECLSKTGDNVFALQFLEDAQKLNPQNYHTYELGIAICRKLGDRVKELEFANRGIVHFDDSNYIKSSL